jgi:vancomycin resistance protein YoaR
MSQTSPSPVKPNASRPKAPNQGTQTAARRKRGKRAKKQSATPTLAKASAAVAKPSPVVAEPSPLAAEPSPVAEKPSLVVEKPSSPLAEASPVVEKPSPVAAKTSPVVEKSSPAVAKPSSLVEKPSQAVARGSRWPLWVAGGTLVVFVVAAGLAFGTYQSWRGGETIAPNVFIAGQEVGGLTKREARQRLAARFENLKATITTPEENFQFALSEIGGAPDLNRAINDAYWLARTGSIVKNAPRVLWARFDETHLPLRFRWNKERLKNRMRRVADEYRQPAQNATLQVTGAGVQVVPEATGRSMNLGATLARLQKVYGLNHTTIEATVREEKPKITSADLEGTDVKLGIYTTTFNRGLIGRTRNIRVSAATVDGKVLMPGETFSFNACTGERTWEKGYRMAHIFERKPGKAESEVVEGLAGGICQVSSTLYNAVRKGNEKLDNGLKIVQRESHSLPVTYVPRGYDATVAWPYKDFKFKNTLPHPIYLRAGVAGSHLNISVWARVPSGDALRFAKTTD